MRLLLAVLAASLAVLALRGLPAGPAAAGAGRGLVVRREAVRDGASHVRVLDVDLRARGVRVEVAAAEIARRRGRVTGAPFSLPQWLERTGAAAGVNGGFFGQAVESGGRGWLEIVGLLKLDGRVRSAAPTFRTRGGVRYAHAAFGLTAAGAPRIGWVTGRPGDAQRLLEHPAPEVKGAGAPWEAADAVGCGPRLIRAGRVEVAARGERLASPGRLPRTFLGFGGRGARADRLVLCAATGMEFRECAEFLAGYFRRRHGFPCREAMALDGGGSTQAAWREGGAVRADSPLNIAVPTAVLVHAPR